MPATTAERKTPSDALTVAIDRYIQMDTVYQAAKTRRRWNRAAESYHEAYLLCAHEGIATEVLPVLVQQRRAEGWVNAA